jgi:hypothetical protein
VKYLVILLSLFSCFVFAESNSLNLNIPNTSRSFQQDRIRSSDGVDCAMAIGSGTSVEFGVVALVSSEDQYLNNVYGQPIPLDPDNFTKDVGVYGKINIPIGGPKERLNCNKLYKLEIEKKELELQKLRQEIVNLRELQFEN